ncbi:MAG: hypothetical protein JJ873_16190 [Maricaulis sp.]|uniref:hypothetical protein n=1 Tax=Maricaulis sp. TaxID=1486257 RepID=UPI001B2E4E6E|nr:hypothetical protein [Maricaulis sp.]MBO6878922.1 hypothetical protein [Maricaulis sp.]
MKGVGQRQSTLSQSEVRDGIRITRAVEKYYGKISDLNAELGIEVQKKERQWNGERLLTGSVRRKRIGLERPGLILFQAAS